MSFLESDDRFFFIKPDNYVYAHKHHVYVRGAARTVTVAGASVFPLYEFSTEQWKFDRLKKSRGPLLQQLAQTR